MPMTEPNIVSEGGIRHRQDHVSSAHGVPRLIEVGGAIIRRAD